MAALVALFTQRLVALMVDCNSRIKLSTGQIFWREAGDNRRPVLLFLHGSWHDRTQWDSAIEILSKNFHCLAIDLLGFGNSIALQTPKSIELEVDCVHEFVVALKLRQVYLIGHSLGAWIAMSYSLKYPRLVQGTIVIDPEGFALINRREDFVTKWLLSHPLLFKFWFNGLKVMTSISDAELLEKSQAYWSFFNKFPTTCHLFFQRSNREIRHELVADRLSQFKLPLLVLQSDRIDRATIAQSQSYANSACQSEYKLIGASASIAPSEFMRQIAQEIQIFIDRIQTQTERLEVEIKSESRS
jgi:pimeloyl-ACP methyl ester carboxylesterase